MSEHPEAPGRYGERPEGVGIAAWQGAPLDGGADPPAAHRGVSGPLHRAALWA